MAGMMLSTQGIGVPDDPLSPYVRSKWNEDARLVAEVAFELGDRVAWQMLLGDVSRMIPDEKGKPRLHLSTVLVCYRMIYGNRPKRPRRAAQRPVSRPAPAAPVPMPPPAPVIPETATQQALPL